MPPEWWKSPRRMKITHCFNTHSHTHTAQSFWRVMYENCLCTIACVTLLIPLSLTVFCLSASSPLRSIYQLLRHSCWSTPVICLLDNDGHRQSEEMSASPSAVPWLWHRPRRLIISSQEYFFMLLISYKLVSEAFLLKQFFSSRLLSLKIPVKMGIWSKIYRSVTSCHSLLCSTDPDWQSSGWFKIQKEVRADYNWPIIWEQNTLNWL